jgi:hypothetical protein
MMLSFTLDKIVRTTFMALFTVLGFVLSGCVSYSGIAKPTPNSIGHYIKLTGVDHQGFLSHVRSINQKVVRDEQAVYYYDLDPIYLKHCIATVKFEASIRDSIQNGKGLMLPVYVGEQGGKVVASLELTRQLHRTLSNAGFAIESVERTMALDQRIRKFYATKKDSVSMFQIVMNPSNMLRYGPLGKGFSTVFSDSDAQYLIDANGGYSAGMLQRLFDQEARGIEFESSNNLVMQTSFALSFIPTSALDAQSNDTAMSHEAFVFQQQSLSGITGNTKSDYPFAPSLGRYKEVFRVDMPAFLNKCISVLDITTKQKSKRL